MMRRYKASNKILTNQCDLLLLLFAANKVIIPIKRVEGTYAKQGHRVNKYLDRLFHGS